MLIDDTYRTHPTQSVLKDAVVAYMAEVDDHEHEDVMRTFFRSKVSDIGKLLRKVLDVMNATGKHSGSQIITLLPEANRIVTVNNLTYKSLDFSLMIGTQTVLTAAYQYRAYNVGVYGIEGHMLNAWTSRPIMIDTVLAFFDLTTKNVDASSSSKEKEPRSQLPTLAGVLFQTITERLHWLTKFVYLIANSLLFTNTESP